MRNNTLPYIVLCCCGSLLLFACASPKNSRPDIITSMKKYWTASKPVSSNYTANGIFSIAFNDRSFRYISLEILTDTLKYIYDFEVSEPRLADTLAKYRMNTDGIMSLVKKMQSIRCSWVSSLDYYVDDRKDNMVFMSIRPVELKLPFRDQHYYILTYFSQPQYFDSEGRLYANRRRRKLRRINGDIFRRINDKVCYTISGRFR